MTYLISFFFFFFLNILMERKKKYILTYWSFIWSPYPNLTENAEDMKHFYNNNYDK